MNPQFSKLANAVILVFEKEEEKNLEQKIKVDPVVAKVASWYEKLRNVMEYREEEVILRATIERILKRRLLFGGGGQSTAEPLVRELVWARYFPDDTLSESSIEKVEKKIDLYLELRQRLIDNQVLEDKEINEWIFQILSSDLERTLSFHKEKEALGNFMFHLMRENIQITDDSEETKNAQVFLAVRKSFAREDLAFLRYHLFVQYFGELTEKSVEQISSSFIKGYQEIQKQLNYPKKDRIYSFVKNKTAVFFILEDLLSIYKGKIRELFENEEEFRKNVFAACEHRYEGIASKVRRAIIRSVFFILITKAIFAITLEGSFENLVFGKIIWTSMVINTGTPPLLMLLISLFIKTPGKENTERIFTLLKQVLSEEKPQLGEFLILQRQPEKRKPILGTIFTLLWFLAFFLSFGAIIYVLFQLKFNLLSQAVFLFFLTIVSFLSYRIWLITRIYNVETKRGMAAPIVDFFLMPVIRVGRKLTEGITQLNIFLFIFDFLIETPFKGLFGFFEQWFLFLHTKREELE